MDEGPARTLRERRTAALERLRAGGNMWLATAADGRGPHLIPVSYSWDGACLLTATFDHSRTLQNVRAQPKVRVSIGQTNDVVMIDAVATTVGSDDVDAGAAQAYAHASGIPRSTPGFVYIRLVPRRMQVWNSPAEFADRTIMRAGTWLEDRP